KTLKFIHTPWVHWPETMCAYMPEEKILFSCDFLGSHLATSEMYAGEDPVIYEGAKRYYAEIMMPFRAIVKKNLAKVEEYDIGLIAPSHGPLYDKPSFILDAYRDWTSDTVDNFVAIPYISMHGSTEIMVDHLLDALVERGVKVCKYELSVTDIGKLAIDLVDAATIVIGAPTVHYGPHPVVFSAVNLANVLRPKLKHAAIIGSYGWATKAVEQISGLIPNLKVEVLGTVMCKGKPRAEDLAALDQLADTIAEKHKAL
ncbi:MAG: FprA family A-type flavoprotein, partial [Aminivibrio sp.]